MTDFLSLHLDRIAKLLTVLLCLQLLWLLVKWMIHSPPEVVLPPDSSFDVRGVDPSLMMPDPNAGISLGAKPLFWAGRQPYVPPEGMDQPLVEDQPAVSNTALRETRLLGVYLGGNTEGAIVAHQGQRLRLSVGESVDGWTLSSVSADSATFASGGESLLMNLEYAVVGASDKDRPVAKKRNGGQNRAPAPPNSNKTGV